MLRLAIPLDGSTTFHDMILGEITVQHQELDDFVIVKTDGIPAYNFAVVVDDITMGISHVIRGQDHVPNTPKQLVLYRLLAQDPPEFAHFPLVMGMEGKKISARYGATALVQMGQAGYLPEAVLNYIAGVGVSFEAEHEIFGRDDLMRLFDLSKVGRSAPAFDEAKLDWMNGVYIRSLPLEDFVHRAQPFLQMRGFISSTPRPEDVEYAARALALEQERVKTLADAPDAIEFFFTHDLAYDPALLTPKKSSPEDAVSLLKESERAVTLLQAFDTASLEECFRELVQTLGLKTGIAFMTLRVALTGRTASPPLFDTMVVLGRERVFERLLQALRALGADGEGSAFVQAAGEAALE